MNEGVGSLVWQLHEIRKSKGLTIKQLSNRSGVSTSIITHYENGRTSPNLDNFTKIIEALNVKVIWKEK